MCVLDNKIVFFYQEYLFSAGEIVDTFVSTKYIYAREKFFNISESENVGSQSI